MSDRMDGIYLYAFPVLHNNRMAGLFGKFLGNLKGLSDVG